MPMRACICISPGQPLYYLSRPSIGRHTVILSLRPEEKPGGLTAFNAVSPKTPQTLSVHELLPAQLRMFKSFPAWLFTTVDALEL